MTRNAWGRNAGFSVLELTVALAVVGVAGLAVWQLLPASRDVAQGDPAQLRLRQAQDAVEGFALRSARLPCPAPVGGSGSEACGATALGELPWRTLGLPRADVPLRYGVYRTPAADLVTAVARFSPLLPPAPVVAGYSAAQVNGLDLCQALRVAAAAPTGLLAGGVPVAYAVADAGPDRVFNLAYNGGFPLAGAPSTAEFDDRIAATGLGELSTRLSCVTRMGETQAAARSAYAALDIYRDAEMFDRFRGFAYQVRIANTKLAIATLSLASLDMLNAIATTASAVSLAANSVGVGAGTIAAGVLSIGAAAGALTAASVQLGLAVTAETKAGKQAADSTVVKARLLAARDAAVAAAAQQDTKGLLP